MRISDWSSDVCSSDLIIRVGDTPDPDTSRLVSIIQQHAGQPLALTLLRDGAQVSLTVVPRAETVQGQTIGRIGVQLGGDLPMVTVRYGLFESIGRAATRTWDTAWLSLRMMGRMVTGEVSWRNFRGIRKSGV